jgi:competence protein ComEA
MRTEPSSDRVHRRLTAAPDSDDRDESDDASDTSLTRWLPDQVGGGAANWLSALRADPGRAGVIGLSVVGVVAVLVTVFMLATDDGPTVVSANLPAVQPVSTAAVSSGAAAPPSDAALVVSVVGLVTTPGLVTLQPGARVADAVQAAGGTLTGADLTGLNMARRIADGEQVVVGISAPPGVPPAMGSSVSAPAGGTASTSAGAPPTSAGASVDLNAASAEELDALPGVGPVTASAIVAWRSANGSFSSVDQLGEVDGIGPARLEKLRALVHV